uniref:Uncharacterized protein n=1 Tax=Lepeophtheirus salmonis TaxID=72036 RepID=A0A0K2TSS3_LEPSM
MYSIVEGEANVVFRLNRTP